MIWSRHLRTFLCVGLATLGINLLATARVYFIEQYFCLQFNPSLAEDALPSALCKDPEVQAALARVNGIYEGLALVPSLILTAPYAALAPRIGKWSILRLSVLGQVAAAAYLSLVVLRSAYWGIEWIWLAPLFDVLGGGTTVFMALAYSTVAENTAHDERLPVLFRLTAFEMVSGFGGMIAASQLLRYSAWILVILGTSAIGLVVPVTYLRMAAPGVHQEGGDAVAEDLASPENEEEQEEQEHGESAGGSIEGSEGEGARLLPMTVVQGPPDSVRATDDGSSIRSRLEPDETVISSMIQSYIAFWQCVRGESLMLGLVVIAFWNRWALSVRVIFVPWASRAYGWAISDSAALQAVTFAVSSVVLLGLPWMERKWLRRLQPRRNGDQTPDLLVAKASLVFNAAGVCAIGLSPVSVLYVLAMCVYSTGVGLESDLQSFGSSLMGDGKQHSHENAIGGSNVVFLGIGLAASVGGILGTAFWSQMFSWLTQRQPGAGAGDGGGGGEGAERDSSSGVLFVGCGVVFALIVAIVWRCEALGRGKGRA